MVTSKGMVQFSGATYRVVERSGLHEIIRVLDDRCVGVFRHYPRIQIIDSSVERGLLLGVIREALHGAKLSSRPRRPPWLDWSELVQHPARLIRSFDTVKQFLMRLLVAPGALTRTDRWAPVQSASFVAAVHQVETVPRLAETGR